MEVRMDEKYVLKFSFWGAWDVDHLEFQITWLLKFELIKISLASLHPIGTNFHKLENEVGGWVSTSADSRQEELYCEVMSNGYGCGMAQAWNVKQMMQCMNRTENRGIEYLHGETISSYDIGT